MTFLNKFLYFYHINLTSFNLKCFKQSKISKLILELFTQFNLKNFCYTQNLDPNLNYYTKLA